MYVYIRSEPQLWTVGYYDPSGKWQSESDHGSRVEAAERVHWLNGDNEGTTVMGIVSEYDMALSPEDDNWPNDEDMIEHLRDFGYTVISAAEMETSRIISGDCPVCGRRVKHHEPT